MKELLAKQVAHFWGQAVTDQASMTELLVAGILSEASAQAGMLAALQGQA